MVNNFEGNFGVAFWGKNYQAGGGGRELLPRKIIYRKIFVRQNHMRMGKLPKQGRWVYEGGEQSA